MDDTVKLRSVTAAVISGSEATACSQPVGSGAFGVVWRVTGGGNNSRRFAVKRLTNCLESVHSTRRAYCELKALTCLKHDNILSAISVVLLPSPNNFSDIYVVSDLMETDLHRIITSGQMLSKSHIQLFLYQIMRGLKYLHSTKTVHSDIKPGNIFVNSNCHLKIGDFGLVCSDTVVDLLSSSSSPLEAAAGTRGACGTLSYLAPEILLGVPVIGSAADMWSTGCLLVEMIIRRVLFHSSSTTQQLDLMLEVIGSPRGIEDFRDAAAAPRRYLAQRMSSRGTASTRPLLDSLLHDVDHAVKHLLQRLLTFSPRQRLTASQALSHIYIIPGQRMYHSSLCHCCNHTDVKHPANDSSNASRLADYVIDQELEISDNVNRLEPVCETPLNLHDGYCTQSIDDLKAKIHELHLKTLLSGSASEYQLHVDSIIKQTVP